MRTIIAVAFGLFAVLIVLVNITQWRFYGAYLDRYAKVESGRRGSRWWAITQMGFRPSTRPSWFRPLDDPRVERRRRQHLLAWGGIAFWFAVPIALILYAAIRG